MENQCVPTEAGGELEQPGARSGEGTSTLWQHMARDELQKTSNRGGGLRDAPAARQPAHPLRRATDRDVPGS
ncbi:hypothetical protein LZ009_23475 [Ramlibacter sp. XY19]|uniref:hypothetical protein n=1 Tax=Ramlibacter paludis TaxID=2908000 RepID=UPI0023DA7B97|nr:hypothetical protein [Ramlibacter paludis]MCG2595750.1 hypothetical protein [Ramlibacter paludis]